MELAVIQTLRGRSCLTAKKLAKATGYSYSSRLRACLARLSRDRVIVRTPDGYAPCDNRHVTS
jgi:hypothetical protein